MVESVKGWPKSSAHGLLATLQSRGFLDLNESDRRYSIGIRTWEVGQAYLGGQDLAQDALHICRSSATTSTRRFSWQCLTAARTSTTFFALSWQDKYQS